MFLRVRRFLRKATRLTPWIEAATCLTVPPTMGLRAPLGVNGSLEAARPSLRVQPPPLIATPGPMAATAQSSSRRSTRCSSCASAACVPHEVLQSTAASAPAGRVRPHDRDLLEQPGFDRRHCFQPVATRSTCAPRRLPAWTLRGATRVPPFSDCPAARRGSGTVRLATRPTPRGRR